MKRSMLISVIFLLCNITTMGGDKPEYFGDWLAVSGIYYTEDGAVKEVSSNQGFTIGISFEEMYFTAPYKGFEIYYYKDVGGGQMKIWFTKNEMQENSSNYKMAQYKLTGQRLAVTFPNIFHVVCTRKKSQAKPGQ